MMTWLCSLMLNRYAVQRADLFFFSRNGRVCALGFARAADPLGSLLAISQGHLNQAFSWFRQVVVWRYRRSGSAALSCFSAPLDFICSALKRSKKLLLFGAPSQMRCWGVN